MKRINFTKHRKGSGYARFSLWMVCALALLVLGCNSATMNLTLQQRLTLDGVPSASGIVQHNDSLYVVGDNAAWLYQLTNDFKVGNRRLLMDGVTDSILPKASKPDLESMTTFNIANEEELLIFGSGSKSPERDVAVRVSLDVDKAPKVYALERLYASLRSSGVIDASTLNIEAAATVGDDLYLFNRETNTVLVYDLKTLLKSLDGNDDLPTPKTYALTLPKLNGLQVKFSGATAIPNQKHLVFTASVEDTPNTYDDGEVLGSYVGTIDLAKLKDSYRPTCVPIMKDGEMIPIKVESVEVLKVVDTHNFELVMVTDSDGGDSELLVGVLNL